MSTPTPDYAEVVATGSGWYDISVQGELYRYNGDTNPENAETETVIGPDGTEYSKLGFEEAYGVNLGELITEYWADMEGDMIASPGYGGR